MKTYVVIALIALCLLNGLLLMPAASSYLTPIAAIGLLLSLLVLTLFLLGSPKGRPAQDSASVSAPATASVAIPPPSHAGNRAEAEVVAFFALLQEKGRLVDFLMEDITSYGDTQVGAAARVIHQGCREVLQENFKIAPISESQEGAPVTVPVGYAKEQYRLVGKLSGEPPFTGTLVHKGWKTEFVKLPRIAETQSLPPIAPAEVELK